MQFQLKWPILWYLKHILLLVAIFLLYLYLLFLDIYKKLAIIPTVLLLINFILADDNINWILTIFLSPSWLSQPNITYLKSLYKNLLATTTIIPSHISLLKVIVALNCLIQNQILVNTLIIGSLNSLVLLIFKYMRSF